MTEYLCIRASEILDQHDLVRFLKTRYPGFTRTLGRTVVEGTETVEARVPSGSCESEEIREFIVTRRERGIYGYSKFTIGDYLRKYTKRDLQQAEILLFKITPHFEPAGEECGTIYETLCDHCNMGRQVSDLILDLRRVPHHKDISETIAWVEWVVSSEFVRAFSENGLTGAEFRPIFEFKNPTKRSREWHQLRVTSKIGELAGETKLGRDPFSPSQFDWHCPLGHTLATSFLSEIYLHRDAWDGSDIAITSALFGQGRNLLRPTPLILVSQRLYRKFEERELRGFSYEVAHLL